MGLRASALVIWIFSLFGALPVFAVDFAPIKSLDGRATLVELFTSEGCPSCPAADTWLSKFSADPALWKEVVPVAFHVNVWDYLGWKDPWGSAYHTQRLKQYNAVWKAPRLRTPVVALNGTEWKDWKPESALPPIKKERAGILSLYPARFQQVRLEFEPELREHKWMGHVAVVAKGMTATVSKGPNKGKTFPEDFVVLAHHFARLKKNGNVFSKTLRLSITPSVPREIALVAWATLHNDPKAVQAVGGPIPLSFLK